MSCSAKNLDPSAASHVNLENCFTEQAKSVDPKADGRSMSQKAVEEWLTKVQIIDNKTINKSDLDALFQKLGKTTVSFSDFNKLLGDLASSKKIDLNTIKGKLLKCG